MKKFSFSQVPYFAVTNGTLDQMVQIYQEGFSGPPWYEDWSDQSVREELRMSLRNKNDVFICHEEETGEIAGFAIGWQFCSRANETEEGMRSHGVSERSYYIAELVTSAKYRRQGVGSGILEFIEQSSRERFVPTVALRTRFDNTALLSILERRGYEKITSYEATTGGVSSTRVVYVKHVR